MFPSDGPFNYCIVILRTKPPGPCFLGCELLSTIVRSFFCTSPAISFGSDIYTLKKLLKISSAVYNIYPFPVNSASFATTLALSTILVVSFLCSTIVVALYG